jgi:hypothetical protein
VRPSNPYSGFGNFMDEFFGEDSPFAEGMQQMD